MIPVAPAKEPPHFDKRVRQKGLSAIDELVGRKPRLKRRGRRRKKIAAREADIPADAFPPFWRDALPDMLEAYERRCTYLALYFEHATGNPTIDHVLPKSRVWDQVYEWSNYRLCAALINAKKNDLTSLVDPFEVAEGWFALELVAFQVIRGPKAPPGKAKEIEETLLVLNMPECLKAREEYVTCYERGDIELSYLERRAPFVASELRRQGQPPARQQLMEEALGSGQKLSESGWAQEAQSGLRWAAWGPALAKVLEPVVQAGRGYEREGVDCLANVVSGRLRRLPRTCTIRARQSGRRRCS